LAAVIVEAIEMVVVVALSAVAMILAFATIAAEHDVEVDVERTAAAPPLPLPLPSPETAVQQGTYPLPPLSPLGLPHPHLSHISKLRKGNANYHHQPKKAQVTPLGSILFPHTGVGVGWVRGR
jgi:hypothetical protein